MVRAWAGGRSGSRGAEPLQRRRPRPWTTGTRPMNDPGSDSIQRLRGPPEQGGEQAMASPKVPKEPIHGENCSAGKPTRKGCLWPAPHHLHRSGRKARAQRPEQGEAKVRGRHGTASSKCAVERQRKKMVKGMLVQSGIICLVFLIKTGLGPFSIFPSKASNVSKLPTRLRERGRWPSFSLVSSHFE